MSIIQSELIKSKQFQFSIIPGTELVSLSEENVEIAEAMLLNDSGYSVSFDKNAAPSPKNKKKGSIAYWMMRLKSVSIDRLLVSKEEYETIIYGAIEAVDRENSTHLNADKVGRSETAKRILMINRPDLVMYLNDPIGTDYKLIDIISEKTNPSGNGPKGSRYKSRANVSFASKFCHYACYYLFDGEEAQDNYPVFDNVLCEVIPMYIEYYGLKKRNMKSYKEYCEAVDAVIMAAGSKISRNGLDHLLWLYYKGRL